MKKFFLPILISLSLIGVGCSAFHVKTNVSPVADVANAGGKIQDTAHLIFVAAKSANAATPPLISRLALDKVAMAVNKTGHLGVDLASALDDYNAVKVAGKDPTAQKVVISKILADLNIALQDVGKAIPPGTLQKVDKLATLILDIIAQVKVGVGL